MGTNKTPKNRQVTITVKAKTLFNLPYPPTKEQIDDNTALTDDEGYSSTFGNENKDFETLVFMNFDMIWDIKLDDKNGTDRGYSVALKSVSHDPKAGNPQFFTSNPLTVGRDKKVRGTIAINPHLENPDDSYTINFSISNGPTTLDFPLDPKLRISPGQ